MSEMSPNENRYDVVVMGGAISGASTALLLRRWHPQLRVLVIEKGTEFDWKVGESTVEISAYFLTRVLRLYDYLSRHQLPKQGFRYWFFNGQVKSLKDASEVGPTQLARTPSFQIDRAHLDEHVLTIAREAGAEVWRPAKVVSFQLKEETQGDNVLVVEKDGQRRTVTTPWIVDASGRAALIARKKEMLHPVEEHPTASIWARFRNVKDLDGVEVWGVDPSSRHIREVVASRRLATNHFVGYGYWIWFIPLRGGETSVGLVWDKRLVDPKGANMEEKLRGFLDENPLTREMLEHAEICPDDIRMFGNLPYLVDQVSGDGWSLVGDAAGFLDPFYSPGLDQMAFSVSCTLDLIRKASAKPEPKAFAEELALHNKRYARFFRYFFDAIYKDKYHVMGDYDTMTTTFLMDTALYYLAAVVPVYRWSADRILVPPYYQDGSGIAFHPMRFYSRRLISIAKRKKALGIYGNHNAGRRPGIVGFSLRASVWVMLGHGLVRWAKAELANAWSYVVRPKRVDGMPVHAEKMEMAAPPPQPVAGLSR